MLFGYCATTLTHHHIITTCIAIITTTTTSCIPPTGVLVINVGYGQAYNTKYLLLISTTIAIGITMIIGIDTQYQQVY